MTALISMVIAAAMAAAVTSGQSTAPSGVQIPADKVVCETMKPKDSPDFVKGSGTFVMKLKLVAKDRFVQVEIKGANKTTFEGKSASWSPRSHHNQRPQVQNLRVRAINHRCGA